MYAYLYQSVFCSPYTVFMCMNVITHAYLLLSIIIYVIIGSCVAIMSLAVFGVSGVLHCVQTEYSRLVM